MNERQLLTKKPCNVTTNSIPCRNSDSGKASVSLLSSTTTTTTTTTTPTPAPPPSPTASAFGCLAPPADAPATVLSLSSRSGCEFHYIESSDRIISSHPQFKSQSNGGSGSPSLVYSIPSFCKKRASENDDNSGDCRHKRMIKNRESAARSRSRKQAYTNGLENEVNRLMEENAELRRQLEKLCCAPDQHPRKKSLQRSLTAPF
ncbi:Protein FD [Camellia lanceoleosa]|uniref:Protein FD n=1 Tax=Camellia lanceoleosa TaxID=1840588 RepID=A0ACC0HLN2_9ERIC|nr:Protein FD [Camellia lanceoleosa]